MCSSLGNQWRRGNPIFSNALLNSIAEEHHTTVSAVVLHWVLSTGAIIIPKSSQEAHVASNAQILTPLGDQIVLTQENIEAIQNLDGSNGKPWE